MCMEKKRKDNPVQSTTLLKFFAKDASETTPLFKKPRKDNNASNQEARSSNVEEQEVIIIDSDEDNAVEVIDILSSDNDLTESNEPLGKSKHRDTDPIEPVRTAFSPLGKCKDLWLDDESTAVSSDKTAISVSKFEHDCVKWDAFEEFSVTTALDGEGYLEFNEDLPALEIDAIQRCPLCGISQADLGDEDLQDHVNNHLDSAESKKYTSLGPSREFLPFQRPPSLRLEPSASSSARTNAFSVLMSGKAEREHAAWSEAQKAEDRNFKPTKNNRRPAPFYKIMTGMPIAVDAFRYGYIPGVEAYFLTHAHSDHYTNLSSNWKGKPIYCSETTANLISLMLSVDGQWLRPLPMNISVVIPDTGGVKVTLIDANHCPGSCLFLFEGLQTVNAGDSTYKSQYVGSSRIFRYLHCGDFRACPQHVLHPQVKDRKIDTVYLDTTYLNPKYCFPPQSLVIEACAELARRIVNGEPTGEERAGSTVLDAFKFSKGRGKQKNMSVGDTLVVVGTYSIGKERIVKAIAKALDTKIFCDGRKTALLKCQDDTELHALLTNKPLEASVHVVPLGQVISDRFKDYVAQWKGRWTRAVAFRPTGWTYSPPAGTDTMPPISTVVAKAQARTFTYADLQPARNSTATLMQYGVPYSEHSSFAELACFALSIDYAKVIATVNVGSLAGREKMGKWVAKWDLEKKKRHERGDSTIVKYRSLEYW